MRRAISLFTSPHARATNMLATVKFGTASRFQSNYFNAAQGNNSNWLQPQQQRNYNNNNNSNGVQQSSGANPSSADSISSRNQGSFMPGRPRFDLYNVHDDATQGFRLTVAFDQRKVYFNHFSQLGPRKTDPMDPAPQFDEVNRHGLRLFIHEIAGFLTVCEGHASIFHVTSPLQEMSFAALQPNGYHLYGTTTSKQSSTKYTWDVKFEGQNATMLRLFLNSALNESFGFSQIQRQYRPRNSYNNANTNNNNNNSYNTNTNTNNNTSNNNNNRNRRQQNNNNNYQQQRQAPQQTQIPQKQQQLSFAQSDSAPSKFGGDFFK